MALFIIVGSVLIDKVISSIKVVYLASIAGLVTAFIFYYWNTTNYGDMDYSHCIRADMQVVDFCKKQNLCDAYIFAPSVLRIDLQDPDAGYLDGRKFNNIECQMSGKTVYCIFSSDEYDKNLYQSIVNAMNPALVKRIEDGPSWREIYKLK